MGEVRNEFDDSCEDFRLMGEAASDSERSLEVTLRVRSFNLGRRPSTVTHRIQKQDENRGIKLSRLTIRLIRPILDLRLEKCFMNYYTNEFTWERIRANSTETIAGRRCPCIHN
jgi:hypothetical protein